MIFEILQTEANAALQFTSDNTVSDKLVNAGLVRVDLATGIGFKKFVQTDSIVVTSVGIRLPYNYCAGIRQYIDYVLYWRDAVTNADLVPIFQMSLTDLNKEEGLTTGSFPGFYSKAPVNANGVKLSARIQCFVSQIGAPDILQGLPQEVVAWAKLTHHYDLIP